MKHTISLAILLTLFTTPAFSWVITADFEEGNVGNNAQLPTTQDAFHGTADNSKIAGSPVYSGSQSASVLALAGETGFGRWGGSFDFPDLKQGDQIWWKVNVFYPSGWDFTSRSGEGMKFMRIHTRSAGNANEGYHHTFIDGGSTGGTLNIGTEVDTSFWDNNPIWPENDPNYPRDLGASVERDQWITYEMQIKFHSEANQGIYRVWQDGILIFEDLKTPTLRSSTSSSDFVYFYTYWNDGAPKTQTSYVDGIVLTNEIPSKKDAHGNPFIGVSTSVPVSAPAPAPAPAPEPEPEPEPTPEPAPDTPSAALECNNWQQQHPEWLWCDDFEDDTSLEKNYFEVNRSNNFGVYKDISFGGQGAIKVTFLPEAAESGNLKFSFGRTPVQPTRYTTTNFDEVYWRFYVKHESDWKGNPYKLTRAMIFSGSNWTQAAIGHIWENTSLGLKTEPVSLVSGDTAISQSYNDFANMKWLGGKSGNLELFAPENVGKWQCIEVRMALNTPNQDNGVLEFWIDEQLQASSSNLDFRGGYTEYGINAIFIENYVNPGAPKQQSRYIDNLVISKQRIGCHTATNNIAAPKPPSGIFTQ